MTKKQHISKKELLKRFGNLSLPLNTYSADGDLLFIGKDGDGLYLAAWMKSVDVRRMLADKGDLSAAGTKVSELLDYVWFIQHDYVEIYENPQVAKRAETFERFSQTKTERSKYNPNSNP